MMTQFTLTDELVQQVTQITQQAGQRIMEIYQRDFDISEKNDSSPLTEADLAAHNHIVENLAKISDLPILSEESASIDWQERKTWVRYWLVDPLDGTKEFIKKNGEFTVNIALIEYGEPIFGVVDAPALEKTYVGVVGTGAKIITQDGESPITATAAGPGEKVKVVGSRSHQSPEIQKILSAIDAEHELVAMGSSLKLCCVADGNAHLYPRVGPTSEWDTGAAHAVVLAAGGKVTVLDPENPFDEDAHPLRYNQKESILNPFFLVKT